MTSEQKEKIIESIIEKIYQVFKDKTFNTRKGILKLYCNKYSSYIRVITSLDTTDGHHCEEILVISYYDYLFYTNERNLVKDIKIKFKNLNQIHPKVKSLVEEAIEIVNVESKIIQDKIDNLLSDQSLMTYNNNILKCQQEIKKLEKNINYYKLTRSKAVNKLIDTIL